MADLEGLRRATLLASEMRSAGIWDGRGLTATHDVFVANVGGGSRIAFDDDRMLYMSTGGGGGNAPQDPSSLGAKVLRLTDDGRVPADNPFVDGSPVAARPEIWSFGVRNPWRYSFDDVTRGGTGALVMGDVGQGAWEEINYEPRGRGGRARKRAP